MAYKSLSLFLASFFITLSVFGQQISITEAFTESFERPVGLEYSHENSSLIYVVQQNGTVKSLDVDRPDEGSKIWFDISDKILASGEKGLLGLAFHPDYPTNETFYINYNFENSSDELLTRISRFHAPGRIADPGSEEILLTFEQPGSNHNGGQLTFGPDGYLYISLGDGGGPQNRDNSQDLTDFFGDILRIDVNTETGYAIPEDNPFVNNSDALDEIYSFGFRNPWRMSFDSVTGELFVADVGEINRESIYLAKKGKNFGWPIVEGTYCFESENCDKSNIEIPFYEYVYDQEDTGRSITGGYVYRGNDNPSLEGKYIYGDFISGRIWALEMDQETMTPLSNNLLLETGRRIPSFGLDSRGEIYTLGWGSNAKIYRFTPELTLTTLALKSVDGNTGVQLNWEVNQTDGIENFEVFRGPAIDELALYQTVDAQSFEYTDPEPIDAVTFYAVRAVETDGTKGEISNPVSFYKNQSILSDSWQLMSIPFDTSGMSLQNTTVYEFDGIYSSPEQLVPGKGYWVRSNLSNGTEFLGEGPGLQSLNINLKQGWNLIGAPADNVASASIVDEGAILNSTPIYGFSNNSYQIAETLSPGQGYWIYAEESGEIAIELEADLTTLPLITTGDKQDVELEEYDLLEFSNGNAVKQLYAVTGQVMPDVKNQYRLPPLSPEPELDIRTLDGFHLSDRNDFTLQITASEYPVSINFSSQKRLNGSVGRESETSYDIVIWKDGERESSRLTPGSPGVVITEEIDKVEFSRKEVEKELVKETKLLPSYPNPFNPITNITYRLSEQQQVTITVFDATGRRIATLVDKEQEAGKYTLPFEASNLASGIYFVRFSAGNVLSTQKLTLIK